MKFAPQFRSRVWTYWVRAVGVVLTVGAAVIVTSPRTLAQINAAVTSLLRADADTVDDGDFYGVKGLDLRSQGRQLADTVAHAVASGTLSLSGHEPGRAGEALENLFRDRDEFHNVLVNDPTLDNIQTFPGTRPFEFGTQSETSVARSGGHIVVGYNSSANQPIVSVGGNLFFTHRFFSGFSTSHDGGRTWASGFVPPTPGSLFTFGDPSVGVDRHGDFYYAGLGADATGHSIVMINKSTTHGTTWAPGVIVATDPGSDKEWLAIGPNPSAKTKDVVYVTWTSFKSASAELWLGRSLDGGTTWTTKSIFAPVNTPIMSSFLQFSNPVVDQTTGRLYVPFLHFGNLDADMIRVLVSDDAGATFHFLTFNAPGAPDAFAYPAVSPGEFVDCGSGGFRLVLRQGADVGGGRFGFARYVHATRLVTQPAAAIQHGRFFLAFNVSTSPFFGDPTAGSEIHLLYSPDGGLDWSAPLTVAPATGADPRHVHPAITVDDEGTRVYVGYYTQQVNTQLRTDVATVEVDGKHLELEERERLSRVAFDLAPTNIPIPITGNLSRTTNWDRTVAACYGLGEYMSIASTGHGFVSAWGDDRRTWNGPAGSAAPGLHSQADVFFKSDPDEERR